MDTTYTGFYASFNTKSKKDAAILLGADSLVGDTFDIVFETEGAATVAWISNKFNVLVGFLNAEDSHRLQVLAARDWNIKALLSCVAFTDSPEPGFYWGEVAVICFEPKYDKVFDEFAKNVAKRLADGVRPEINLAEQGIQQLISSQGTWMPSKSIPFPTKKPGTALVKSHRKMSEKLIEQGRRGNKGCYLVSWLFLLAFVAGAIFGLKSCGVF